MIPTRLDYLILMAAQLAIGSAALVARLGLDAGLSPLSLAAWRLATAALLLMGLRTARRATPEPLAAGDRWRLVVAGVVLAGHFITWFISLKLIPVARSTLLVTTAPLWTSLGSWLVTGEVLPRTFWFGLALAAPGVYLVTAKEGPIGGNPSLAGDGLAVLGGMLMAAYLVLVQDIPRRIGTWRAVRWTYSSAAVALLMAVVVSADPAFVPRSARAVASIAAMALIPQLLGHTALNRSLSHFPAGLVGASTLLEPVFAGFLAWWFLGEPVTARQCVGAVILLAGVGISLKRQAPAV